MLGCIDGGLLCGPALLCGLAIFGIKGWKRKRNFPISIKDKSPKKDVTP